MLFSTMELRRQHVEDFIRAYKHDVGEDLTYQEAFEMMDRLVRVFLILEKAEQKLAREREESAGGEDV